MKRSYLSQAEYDRHGRYSHRVVVRRFGSWKDAVGRAGLRPAVRRDVDETELFYDLLAVWLKLGRRPTTEEFHRPLSKFSVRPYQDRFGSWRRAMKAFFEWLRWTDLPEAARSQPSDRAGAVAIEPGDRDLVCRPTDHKTPRRPSLRQRFRVMLRDSFRCRLCGRSPATHPALHLNIDHIVPWSKGGETIDENLQTLCSDCNQGKFDHHPGNQKR